MSEEIKEKLFELVYEIKYCNDEIEIEKAKLEKCKGNVMKMLSITKECAELNTRKEECVNKLITLIDEELR